MDVLHSRKLTEQLIPPEHRNARVVAGTFNAQHDTLRQGQRANRGWIF